MTRMATIYAPNDEGPAATRVIDLNIVDQISRLVIMWRNTNVTVSVMSAPVASCITLIELVDGSDVLFSMTGQQAQALNYYDRKIMPFNAAGLAVGAYYEAEMAIDFGRYLWDPDFAFRPNQFRNPQLRITHDETACDAAGTPNRLAVYAYIDEAPAKMPVGFLMSKNMYTYDMIGSAHEYIDLPTDYPIRKILLQLDQDGHDPVLLLDNIKLGVDNDKSVLVDMAFNEFCRFVNSENHAIVEKVCLDEVVTVKAIYANSSMDNVLVIQQDDTAVTAAGEIQAVTWTGHLAALTLGVVVQSDLAIVRGRIPHNCVPLDMGAGRHPESWLQAQQAGSIRLDLTESATAATGDTGRVAVQQARNY